MTNTDRIQAILKSAQEGSSVNNDEVIWLVQLFVASIDTLAQVSRLTINEEFWHLQALSFGGEAAKFERRLKESRTQVSSLKKLIRDVDGYMRYDIRAIVNSELWDDWEAAINAED